MATKSVTKNSPRSISEGRGTAGRGGWPDRDWLCD